MSFSLTSAAFDHGATIPDRHTCEGENRSPGLRWRDVPAGARSLALIVEDPDAPHGVFYHWVLYNLSPALHDLPDGQPRQPHLAQIGAQGVNSFRRTGYDGPCPPPGRPHRYVFRLYALDLPADLAGGLTAEQLLKAVAGRVLAQAEWMGTYHR